jgi:hypothetical protein
MACAVGSVGIGSPSACCAAAGTALGSGAKRANAARPPAGGGYDSAAREASCEEGSTPSGASARVGGGATLCAPSDAWPSAPLSASQKARRVTSAAVRTAPGVTASSSEAEPLSPKDGTKTRLIAVGPSTARASAMVASIARGLCSSACGGRSKSTASLSSVSAASRSAGWSAYVRRTPSSNTFCSSEGDKSTRRSFKTPSAARDAAAASAKDASSTMCARIAAARSSAEASGPRCSCWRARRQYVAASRGLRRNNSLVFASRGGVAGRVDGSESFFSEAFFSGDAGGGSALVSAVFPAAFSAALSACASCEAPAAAFCAAAA